MTLLIKIIQVMMDVVSCVLLHVGCRTDLVLHRSGEVRVEVEEVFGIEKRVFFKIQKI